jgi:hypothetical protein
MITKTTDKRSAQPVVAAPPSDQENAEEKRSRIGKRRNRQQDESEKELATGRKRRHRGS